MFTRQGTDIDHYPAIRKYLEAYRLQLEPKPRTWDEKKNGSWRGRKAGPYKWYEIQDTVAYWENFESPKIIVPEITNSNNLYLLISPA